MIPLRPMPARLPLAHRLLAFLFYLSVPLGAQAADEPEALFFDPFHEAPNTFQIAFWRDPDEAAVAALENGDPLHERLKLFARRLIQEASDVLIADSFGSLSVTLIQDYDRLYDERWTGVNYNLLHCDPAVHLEGRGFPSSGRFAAYELFLEQDPDEADARGAGIWVNRESPIEEIGDLVNRHIARVHDSSLLGGALQRAELARHPRVRLRQGFTAGKGDYLATSCGSVSETIFRLITGLATERPIDAAFLPLSGPGFDWALREMNLRSVEDLPIRLLQSYEFEAQPRFPLLISRIPEISPSLRDRLEQIFLEVKGPFQWSRPSMEYWNRMAERIGVPQRDTEIAP